MSITRAVAVLAVAAAASAPATAYAEPTCVDWGSRQYVCHDPDYPGCVVYGWLGEEAMFHLGDGCPWPWGNG